ncbi:MAG: hypothetical protein ACXWLG_00620 [Myxococcaceae bacterium]
MKRSTMEFYRSRLEAQVLPALGHLAVTAVSTAAVSDFTAELFAWCNPGGVNAVLRALRVLLGFAVKQGILEKAPAVPMVEEPEPDDELSFVPRAETDAFPRCAARLRARLAHAFFVTAFRTGLRIGELIELRWKDVNSSATSSTFAAPATTATSRRQRAGAGASFPSPPRWPGALRPLVGPPDRLVFCYPDGSPFDSIGPTVAMGCPDPAALGPR